MTRKTPSAETLRLLYVRSGNECAFPDCEHPIFNDEGLYIAQLCHIKGANPGGQRYDKKQSDEDRCSYDNLLFMCHRHHKETDNEDKYGVEKLIEIKANHESKFIEKGRKLSKDMLLQVLFEANYFWDRQSKKTFEFQDLKIERDFSKDIFDLFVEMDENIEFLRNYCDSSAESDSSEVLQKDLKELLERAGLDYSKLDEIKYWENPFINRNWEMHNLGRPNIFSHISLCLSQLKIKTTEELLKNKPDNYKLKELLEEYRNAFDNLYDNTYYAD